MANNEFSSPIIVACDKPTLKEALELAQQLDPKLCRIKVGKELFTREGPRAVEALMALGFEIFLDLKFHDIPNTVSKACYQAAALGVWMLNVHTLGGKEMLLAAREGIDKSTQSPLLIGVTVLTSLSSDDLNMLGFNIPISALASSLAQSAHDTKLDGVVASAQEAHLIKQSLPSSFLVVSPGIRLDSSSDDQKRVMNAKDALENGSDYLVIGRPITQANNPKKIIDSLLSTLLLNKDISHAI